MQPLTDGPRSNLTPAQVRALLQSDSVLQVSYGAVGLDGDFGEVADISDYVGAGSSVTSSLDSTIHRTCQLTIDSDVTDLGWSYLDGFVKPYMILTDPETGVSAQFFLGVYTLTTPTRDLGTVPASSTFAGYDLIYLLRQPVGDSYEAPAGADPAVIAAEVVSLAIPEVEVVVAPSGSTLPNQLTWPFDPSQPTTFLDIIETLLASIGYRQVWADWNGTIHVEDYVDLMDAPVEWTFDTSDMDNIVSDDRQQDVDIYDVPNWWRFVMADLPDTPVEGQTMYTYEDTAPENPGSTVNRGRTIRYIESVAAATYDDLVGYAQRKIGATLAPGETFTVKTQPFPLAWHMDVIQFNDEAMATALPTYSGGTRLVVSTGWQIPLDGQDDMDWTWQTVTVNTVGLGLSEEEVT